ncbi:MAG: succinate--CoA ligase subunit alpha [Thermoplasmatota archaeon]
MAILVTGSTQVIVQGVTSTPGRAYTKQMLAYGTKVVGGVSPGRGGETVHGLPVYDTVRECQEHHPDVKATAIWVPPKHARDAVLEAVEAGIKLIVLTTQGVPAQDIIQARRRAWERGLVLLGGNTMGAISPGRALVGMLPTSPFSPGAVGVVSRSALVSYYIANTLDLAGMGVSTCAVLGGDLFTGCGYEEILSRFEEDPETRAVVLAGQPGGALEETAAGFIKSMRKPVVAYITGVNCPDVLWPERGFPPFLVPWPTGASKVRALREAGLPVAETPMDIPRLLKKLIKK